jgi:hypothetical protein
MKLNKRGYVRAVAAASLIAVPFLVGATSGSGHARARTQAQAPVCGATVTASVVLTQDLSCSSGNGLVVGANAVTINLNGHKIAGNGLGGTYGVYDNGHSGLVVENGVVDNFDVGVYAVVTSGVHIVNMRIENNTDGVFFDTVAAYVISGNYLISNTNGLGISGGGGQVTGNWAEKNTSDGFDIEDSTTPVTVSTNNALDNATGFVFTIGPGLLTNNVANSNSGDGFVVGSPGSGVKAVVTLRKNRAAFNAQLGINSTAGGSVDGGGNVVQANGTATQCANVACHAVST